MHKQTDEGWAPISCHAKAGASITVVCVMNLTARAEVMMDLDGPTNE